jgi:hypothetical protein
VGLPLAFTLSLQARREPSRRAPGTVALVLSCVALLVIVAQMVWDTL